MMTSEEKVLREAVREYWQLNHSFSLDQYENIEKYLTQEYSKKNINEKTLMKPFLWTIEHKHSGLLHEEKDKVKRDEILEAVSKKIAGCLDNDIKVYAINIAQIYAYALEWYDCNNKFIYDDMIYKSVNSNGNESDRIIKLEEAIEYWQEEAVSYKTKFEEVRHEADKLKELCNKEIDAIKLQLKDKTEQLNKAIKNNFNKLNDCRYDNYKEDIKQKDEIIKEQTKEIEEKDEIIAKQKKEIEHYKQIEADYISERGKVFTEKNNANIQLENIKEENREIKKIYEDKYEEKIKAIKEIIAKMKRNTEKKNEEIQGYKKSIEDYKVEVEKYIEKIDVLNHEKAELQTLVGLLNQKENVKSEIKRGSVIQRESNREYAIHRDSDRKSVMESNFYERQLIDGFNKISENFTNVQRPIDTVNDYIKQNGFARYSCINADEVVRNQKAILKLMPDSNGDFFCKAKSDKYILLLNPKKVYQCMWLSMHSSLFKFIKHGDKIMKIKKPAILNSDFSVEYKGEIELY